MSSGYSQPGGVRPYFAGTAVTDVSGNATFTFPAGLFGVPPTVTAVQAAPASNNPIDLRVVSVTATTAVINVRQSAVLIVLSLSVLGLSAPLAGVTIHLHATPAGVAL